MKSDQELGNNTLCVHAGYHVENGPVNPPIEESSTYKFKNCADGAERFASPEKEGIYSRLNNSTVNALENKIAILENGHGAIATASGMAAVNALYFTALGKNKHIIASESLYGPCRTILENKNLYGKWGVKATFLNTNNINAIKKEITPDTKLIYVETPANPTLAMTDISKVSELAKKYNIFLAVDNTFCSPYLQKPLDHGADAVIHSMTKSIGGHSNAIGGMIVTKNKNDHEVFKNIVVNTGGTLSPHDADLFNTGIKTLGIRTEKMQQNCQTIVDYLSLHPKVSWINYPGLPEHPQNYLVGADKQMKGPGSMISFGVKNGLEGGTNLLDNLDTITLAVSLGGVESLIQHPASMTHAGMKQDARIKAGITDDLVRLSVGVENVEDLLNDLDKGLKKV